MTTNTVAAGGSSSAMILPNTNNINSKANKYANLSLKFLEGMAVVGTVVALATAIFAFYELYALTMMGALLGMTAGVAIRYFTPLNNSISASSSAELIKEKVISENLQKEVDNLKTALNKIKLAQQQNLTEPGSLPFPTHPFDSTLHAVNLGTGNWSGPNTPNLNQTI